MKIIAIIAIFALSLSFFVISAEYVNAQAGGSGTSGLTNPLGADATPQKVIGRVIKAVLGLVGSIALAMFVYGGLTWMTSAGNDSAVDKGRKILMWAAIGLIVVFSSYGILIFVLKDVLEVS